VSRLDTECVGVVVDAWLDLFTASSSLADCLVATVYQLTSK